MGKDKIRRFAAVKEFDNFYEPVIKEPFPMKGKWREQHFKNENPIVLELGCGKGEYSVGLAKHFPNKNFIGVDIKGARMFIGAEKAINDKMDNVAFLRMKIDFIDDYFGENEVDEIWLTFSDPQPKKVNKRLSSPPFIERYRKMLKPGGIVHMKTDSDLLFEYTEEQIKEHNYELLELTWNLYGDLPENIDPVTRDIFHIKTHYEKLFTSRGSVIKYCKFLIG
ncbi:MAG TPA: tRNA (guanosine(46)-N7)-methyltransferase TrmB [Crocinitomicaceae bacterium]|nr:tRNA (guanosine(46)-N7)-methyltransferase TrmB [Crocinitomicaceae bacterium]